MKTLLLVLVALVIACGSSRAMIYMRWDFTCSDNATSYAALVKDDVAGKGYLVYVRCDGSVNVWPVICRVSSKVGDLQAPQNLHELCSKAIGVAYPGVSVGIYLSDIVSGDIIRFRNPESERERNAYAAMWKREVTLKSPTPTGH
jgi:hypothetical protein